MAVKKIDYQWYLNERHIEEDEAIKWNDENIKNEAKILSCLSHPNIINLLGWFIMSNSFYLVLDYHGGGTLADCIPQNGRDEFSTLCLMIQVFEANILLSADRKRLVLADFGQAQLENDNEINNPEYFQSKFIGGGTDLKKLICIVWELRLTRELPYNQNTSIQEQVLMFPDHISLPAQHFVQSLLSVDPCRRMTISEVFDHSWLRIHDITGRHYQPRRRLRRFHSLKFANSHTSHTSTNNTSNSNNSNNTMTTTNNTNSKRNNSSNPQYI
ncbi:10230_t:CDS:2 [Diversispora eburnea]|uniref:non-specific serine/threonine protein kinase n=1 Tax=Diversispora eburnea TaxID=1213867 RepID=A0A9N8YR49_9GLOM|nr:10230_t:CDS:2 [Diversispora eburnea]